MPADNYVPPVSEEIESAPTQAEQAELRRDAESETQGEHVDNIAEIQRQRDELARLELRGRAARAVIDGLQQRQTELPAGMSSPIDAEIQRLRNEEALAQLHSRSIEFTDEEANIAAGMDFDALKQELPEDVISLIDVEVQREAFVSDWKQFGSEEAWRRSMARIRQHGQQQAELRRDEELETKGEQADNIAELQQQRDEEATFLQPAESANLSDEEANTAAGMLFDALKAQLPVEVTSVVDDKEQREAYIADWKHLGPEVAWRRWSEEQIRLNAQQQAELRRDEESERQLMEAQRVAELQRQRDSEALALRRGKSANTAGGTLLR
jgi:hypothetical protein